MVAKDKRISSKGVIIIRARQEKSQKQNREIALKRLKEIILASMKVPKKRLPTKPTAASQKKRLDEKKKHSQTKATRKRISDPERE